MHVFWVLFLVLLKTIGNQGDPNHGLINLETGSEDIPLYIGSMRNYASCHSCTGSIISPLWILSAFTCYNASHFLHGLKEYEFCTKQRVGIEVEEVMVLMTTASTLYRVKQELDKTVPKLFMPISSSSSLPQTTAAVVGWSYDGNKQKIVMNKIADVNTTDAFSDQTKNPFFMLFCHELNIGSPLIVNGTIYGFVRADPCGFEKFLSDVNAIRKKTGITG